VVEGKLRNRMASTDSQKQEVFKPVEGSQVGYCKFSLYSGESVFERKTV
jgi:hypothetical protein